MLLGLLPLALAADGLSPPCAAERAASRTAWHSAALPSIQKVASCGGSVTDAACVAAVDELAALGEVDQALESEAPSPREALIAAVAKARLFLAPRAADTYAPLRASLEELTQACQTELEPAERR